jgi:spermidine synthase
MGLHPQFTLVDIDEVVLKWAIEFSDKGSAANMNPVCEDALDFMNRNTTKFDLIFVDIFNGRTVPDFVTSQAFLEQCKASLTPAGCLGFNYIINDDEVWDKDHNTFMQVFPDSKLISFDMNRVFVACKINH